MADVTLRESLDLMRSFLRAGHLAEAFALGRHILHFYPKHIETYTVLAQVSLATNDIAGANDLLRRVLSSDPENVIALAGMALISEAQDKQDEALWYLERAYEIQPSNDELRGELLRVREQYYGTAPARVELTPGALARVYARQGQYAQAVSEYRRLLRSETHRYDAQVGLAETLYRAGRTDEAAQVAQTVMADAPYSLKPNLILGALWTENAVPEGQQFLQRAHQLDPEHRVARDLLGERFDGADPPTLPEMGEAPVTPTVPAPLAQPQTSDEYPPERDTVRAALLLSEIERAQALEATAQEPLVADRRALDDALTRQTEIDSAGPGTAAQVAAGVVAVNLVAEALQPPEASAASPTTESAPVDTVDQVTDAPPTEDPTLLKIAAAEQMAVESAQPLDTKSTEKPAPGKRDGVSTEVIAAAAAALATSIALDKSNQPAPTRRTHSAIPKVRPVIPGNTVNLPSWLYLSATPANANASFDALPPATQEEVAPLRTEPDRPDWLVQAEAATASEPVSVNPDDTLPDWLKPAAVVGAAAAAVSIADQIPKSTSDAPKSQSDETLDAGPPAAAAAAALPIWLRDEPAPAEPVIPYVEPSLALASSAEDTMPLEQPPVPEPISSAAVAHPAEAEFSPALPLAAVTTAAMLAGQEDDESSLSAAAGVSADETLASSAQSDTHTVAAAGESVVDSASADVPVAAAANVDESPVAGPAVSVADTPAVAERQPVQAQPDSAAMLRMARDRRDSGDLKGALELYGRVMHRRPNYIEQVTADLEAIVNAGGAPLSANGLLGEAYAMVGRFKESLVQYRTALGK